jgi:hypothetical protein
MAEDAHEVQQKKAKEPSPLFSLLSLSLVLPMDTIELKTFCKGLWAMVCKSRRVDLY